MQIVVTAAQEIYCQNTPLGEKKIQWQLAVSKEGECHLCEQSALTEEMLKSKGLQYHCNRHWLRVDTANRNKLQAVTLAEEGKVRKAGRSTSMPLPTCTVKLQSKLCGVRMTFWLVWIQQIFFTSLVQPFICVCKILTKAWGMLHSLLVYLPFP